MFNVLGIDWGSKRFGLSFGDKNTGLVIPAKYVCLSEDIFDNINREVSERGIKKIVVGSPTNFVGEKTEISKQISDFVKQLKEAYPNLEIITVNESGSSKESRGSFANTRKIDKDMLNHLAAEKILHYYFEYYS